MQASGESPPPFRAAPLQAQSRPSREKDLNWKPSARLVQPGSSLLFTGPTRLLQDCLHKSLKSLPAIHQPSPASAHHTSLNALHHTCQSSLQLSDSEQHNHPHFAHHFHHHAAHHSRPSSGHHTCPGFLHHRDSSSSAKPEASVKLSSRSSSYEKSAILSKSAASSKAASPMPSPHPSPRPSPCPSPCPSLITPAAPPCSPDRPCSPALTQKVIITDMNRLSADSRPQQRGTQAGGYVCVLPVQKYIPCMPQHTRLLGKILQSFLLYCNLWPIPTTTLTVGNKFLIWVTHLLLVWILKQKPIFKVSKY